MKDKYHHVYDETLIEIMNHRDRCKCERCQKDVKEFQEILNMRHQQELVRKKEIYESNRE